MASRVGAGVGVGVSAEALSPWCVWAEALSRWWAWAWAVPSHQLDIIRVDVRVRAVKADLVPFRRHIRLRHQYARPASALPIAAYCVLGVDRTLTDSTQLTMVALVLVVGSSST